MAYRLRLSSKPPEATSMRSRVSERFIMQVKWVEVLGFAVGETYHRIIFISPLEAFSMSATGTQRSAKRGPQLSEMAISCVFSL